MAQIGVCVCVCVLFQSFKGFSLASHSSIRGVSPLKYQDTNESVVSLLTQYMV